MPSAKRYRTASAALLFSLIQGVFFDPPILTRNFGSSKSMVSRVLRSLCEAGVIERIDGSKYLLKEDFKQIVKKGITSKMPRDIFLSFPDNGVYDLCGIESWSQEEIDGYTKRLKEYWASRSKGSRKMAQ